MELRNWAGNIRFSTDRVHHPETVGQVQEIVRKSQQGVPVVFAAKTTDMD